MDILNYREDTNTMRTAILFLVSFVIDLLLVGAYLVLAGGTVPSDIIIWSLSMTPVTAVALGLCYNVVIDTL